MNVRGHEKAASLRPARRHRACAVVVVGLLALARPVAAQPARTLTLAATGDVLLHASVVESARTHGGWPRALAGLSAAMERGDLGIVNMEGPLVDDLVRTRGGDHPVLGAPSEVAAVLAAAGVDVAGVANNHAYDQGVEGLSRTVAVLGAAGITAVGAASTPAAAPGPFIVEHDGLRVAFVGATGPLNRHPLRYTRTIHVARIEDEDALLAAVRQARARADVVVALMHWMWDYLPAPNPPTRVLARRLIEAGADVLIGTGPHLLMPVERVPSDRGEAVIAWSLGNLISGMGREHRVGHAPRAGAHPVTSLPGTRDAVVLRIGLALGGGHLRATGLSARPLWTLNDWRTHGDAPVEIRVVPLSETPPDLRAERLAAIREALGPAVTVE